jgi:hypothetical protein
MSYSYDIIKESRHFRGNQVDNFLRDDIKLQFLLAVACRGVILLEISEEWGCSSVWESA